MLNTHFETTLKILIRIAISDDGELTSQVLARELETNPAFVRKILSKLSKANLIETKRGKNGGVKMLKDPKLISLKEVYKSVFMDEENKTKINNSFSCPIICSSHKILLSLSKKFEAAQLLFLSQIKLSTIIKDAQNAK